MASEHLIIGDDTPKLDDNERSETIDLADNTLQVDISDALSEREKVKFTVHTKTELKDYKANEFSVIREHEEFLWLHERFVENPEYAGYIIPPPPPKPDFDASREKLQKLSEGEGTMTKEEFTKMKQELEAEYLATFKKTVAMHEVFLQRLCAHTMLRSDENLKVFLEYKEDLSVRGKNTKELLRGFGKAIGKSVDENVLLRAQKDVDDFFESERKYVVDYANRIKDAASKCDNMTGSHKRMSDVYIKMSTGLTSMATVETPKLEQTLNKTAEALEKLRKIEGRMATDEDLKLADLLRYQQRDTDAAKGLLFRRLRCLANLENANKNLDRARSKNKDIEEAEKQQQLHSETFENMSETAKVELAELKKKKVSHFKKNLNELAELEMKHSKAQVNLLTATINALKA